MRREFDYTIDEVFSAIKSERNYQDNTWNANEDEHSLEEWLLYIENHLNEAKQVVTRGEKNGGASALDILRRIAAMAVLAMEQNGAEVRDNYEEEEEEDVVVEENNEESDDVVDAEVEDDEYHTDTPEEEDGEEDEEYDEGRIYTCPECSTDLVLEDDELVRYEEPCNCSDNDNA
jgi:rubrerythrin